MALFQKSEVGNVITKINRNIDPRIRCPFCRKRMEYYDSRTYCEHVEEAKRVNRELYYPEGYFEFKFVLVKESKIETLSSKKKSSKKELERFWRGIDK